MAAAGFVARAKRALLYAVLYSMPLACAQAENSTVHIKGYAFDPATVTITVGSSVTWINQDDDPHTLKSAGSDTALKSPALDTHDEYSFTFTKPGVYKYFCTLHPHMQGEIIVQ